MRQKKQKEELKEKKKNKRKKKKLNQVIKSNRHKFIKVLLNRFFGGFY